VGELDNIIESRGFFVDSDTFQITKYVSPSTNSKYGLKEENESSEWYT